MKTTASPSLAASVLLHLANHLVALSLIAVTFGALNLHAQTIPFRITNLGTTGSAIEHISVTGDDRGGIAVGTSQVFVSGDTSTGKFSASDLSGGTSLGVIYDGLCSDLSNEKVYTLGTGSSTPVTNGGGVITHLLELDSSTGALTGNFVTLNSSVAAAAGTGIYSGWGGAAHPSGACSFHPV